jgi:hypothetical protein
MMAPPPDPARLRVLTTEEALAELERQAGRNPVLAAAAAELVRIGFAQLAVSPEGRVFARTTPLGQAAYDEGMCGGPSPS